MRHIHDLFIGSMKHVKFKKSLPIDVLDTGFSHLKFVFWINNSNIVNRFSLWWYAVFSENEKKFHAEMMKKRLWSTFETSFWSSFFLGNQNQMWYSDYQSMICDPYRLYSIELKWIKVILLNLIKYEWIRVSGSKWSTHTWVIETPETVLHHFMVFYTFAWAS